jgi:membrane protein YdbS with pleckstrin-like domain
MERLDPRVRVAWALGALAPAVGVGVAGVLLDRFVTPVPAPATAGLALLVAVLGVAHAVLRYRRWRFEVQADALYLERGVVTEVETAVPYVRVQHVDTRRGPVARLLGLATVVVYTAGSRGADVSVPGLSPERARELRNRLRELAAESDGGDAV